eukprot:TRINITY_DN4640_c0_g1_i3.p1 TRINITY_DN4640_c0_g1~~TRINITY_DN4640_c0_g1_i3.p1  ORF type:complete len:602 (+),score=116.35 TRINITY_DN4640_c0_g1_i3:61-1866(+)
MFKKPFQLSQSHKLSGADRKKLRKQLQQALKRLSQDDEAIDLIIPAKNGEVTVGKFGRMQVYLLDGQPILVDTSGKGDFFPTVFALWKVPDLVPVIHVKHPAVSQYVVGGADLMVPGVLVDTLPLVEEGAVVSVGVVGNDAPVAIGKMLLSSENALDRIAGGAAKGRLVQLMHHYRDFLWQLDDSGYVPNDGYLQNAVMPVGWDQENSNQEDMEQLTQDLQQSGIDEQAQQQQQEEEQGCSSNQILLSTNNQQSNVESISQSVESEDQSQPGIDMDDTLITSFLQALHKVIKDEQLPMNSSTLWGHILTVQPPGSRLDIKKTSFKKLGKFLQAQVKIGLITSKEDKHTHENYLLSINRAHELYDNFRPYKMPKKEDLSSSSSQQQNGGNQDSSKINNTDKLSIEELLKPSKELSPIFKAMEKSVDELYTQKEAGEIAFGYIQANELDQKIADPRRVLLDPVMTDALFRGLMKKGVLFPTIIEKAELRQQFLKRMLPQWRIRRGGAEIIKKGVLQPIQISLEKRQGNKKVTRVVGVELFLLDPPKLGSSFQKKFACATNVNELEGKKKEFEIMVQGSFVDQVTQYLRQDCSIPQKFVQVKGK